MGKRSQEVHVKDDKLICSTCNTPLQLHGSAAIKNEDHQFISECTTCKTVIRLKIEVVRVFSKKAVLVL